LIIKNREELISSGLRARAVELIESGIKSVMPAELMQSAVKFNQAYKKLTVMEHTYLCYA